MMDDQSDVVHKLAQMEQSLKVFRAEVNMKMSIVEQILSNRNEQFEIQKELFNREQFLYQTLMGHWKSIAGLAANGISLQFSEPADKPVLNKELNTFRTEACSEQDDASSDESPSVRKRSAAKARRERHKRLEAKRRRTDVKEKEVTQTEVKAMDVKHEPEVDVSSPAFIGPSDMEEERVLEGAEGGTFGDSNDFENQEPGDDMEKLIFVNFYVPGPFKRGVASSNPVWKHFLRAENGAAALCKPCEAEGLQTLIKIRSGSYNLTRHLRRHKEAHEENEKDSAELMEK